MVIGWTLNVCPLYKHCLPPSPAADPDLRCRSLYLFCSLVLSFLLPLLLLIAMHQRSGGDGSRSSGTALASPEAVDPAPRSRTARFELWLQARLGLLLLQPEGPSRSEARRAGQRRQQRQQATAPGGCIMLCLRWLLLMLALWAASRLAVEGF